MNLNRMKLRLSRAGGKMPQTETGQALFEFFTAGTDRFPVKTLASLANFIRLVEEDAAEQAIAQRDEDGGR